MKLKDGVHLTDLSPQMVLAAMIVREIYESRDINCSCTITSGNDSTHSEHSLHYKGRALDFRTHDFSGNKEQLLAEIKGALGADFDVVLEDPDGANQHIHVEWDVK